MLLLTVKKQQGPVNSQTYQRQVDNILRSTGHGWGAALEIAVDLFKKQPPVLAYYQEIRLLAKMLNRWDTLRPLLIAHL